MHKHHFGQTLKLQSVDSGYREEKVNAIKI